MAGFSRWKALTIKAAALPVRARDGRNYYIARFNPLEDNFRVYHVVNGVRTQLQSADVKRTPGWHPSASAMSGIISLVRLDGKELLDVKDRTFSEAGMIGLWSKGRTRGRQGLMS